VNHTILKIAINFMTFSYCAPFSRNSKLTLIDRINSVKEHTSGD